MNQVIFCFYTFFHTASHPQISNYGEDFYVGFMRNYIQTTSQLKLVVLTEDNLPVKVGVETSSGVVYTGTTTASSPVTVSISNSLQTNSGSYFYRNNGIHVYTIGQGSISVLTIN